MGWGDQFCYGVFNGIAPHHQRLDLILIDLWGHLLLYLQKLISIFFSRAGSCSQSIPLVVVFVAELPSQSDLLFRRYIRAGGEEHGIKSPFHLLHASGCGVDIRGHYQGPSPGGNPFYNLGGGHGPGADQIHQLSREAQSGYTCSGPRIKAHYDVAPPLLQRLELQLCPLYALHCNLGIAGVARADVPLLSGSFNHELGPGVAAHALHRP